MASMIDYMLQTDAMLQKNRNQELLNQKQVQHNQFYPRQAESELAMQGAQTQGQNLLNTKQGYVNNLIEKFPILGASNSLLPGYLGQLVGADILADYNPEMGAMAKLNNQLQLENTESQKNARDIYASSAWFRGLPAINKEQVVLANQNNGWTAAQLQDPNVAANMKYIYENQLSPQQYYAQFPAAAQPSTLAPMGSQSQPATLAAAVNPVAPTVAAPTAGALTTAMQNNNALAQTEAGQTQSKIDKSIRTTKQIDRSTAGKNAETTLSAIESLIPEVKNFAGGEGLIKRNSGKLSAFLGDEPSQGYQDYNTFQKTLVEQLVNQITPFYATSVQPEVRKKIETTFKPQWDETPDMYENRMRAFSKVLKAELIQQQQDTGETIREPAAILNFSSQSEQPEENAQSNVRQGYVAMRNPQGQLMQVPEDRTADAEKAGWQRG